MQMLYVGNPSGYRPVHPNLGSPLITEILPPIITTTANLSFTISFPSALSATPDYPVSFTVQPTVAQSFAAMTDNSTTTISIKNYQTLLSYLISPTFNNES
jgi:hypothetical protein